MPIILNCQLKKNTIYSRLSSLVFFWLVLCMKHPENLAKMRKFLAYFIPVILAFAIGALGSYIQGTALEEWYPYLVKSAATPPALVFPIAWGVLYLLMGISVGTMLEKGDLSVLRLWLLQLLLNFLWSVCFFALRSPFLGLFAFVCFRSRVISSFHQGQYMKKSGRVQRFLKKGVDFSSALWYNTPVAGRNDGIGRRAGLKIQW